MPTHRGEESKSSGLSSRALETEIELEELLGDKVSSVYFFFIHIDDSDILSLCKFLSFIALLLFSWL